jgi:sulfide:quinone oxidoreductase
MQPHPPTDQPLKVTIAGGGVAGLEAAFALHELAADRVAVTVVSPGAELLYDALIVTVGASLQQFAEHATNVDDRRMDELLHGLVQDIEDGYTTRLAIIVPGPMAWPFPAYSAGASATIAGSRD